MSTGLGVLEHCPEPARLQIDDLQEQKHKDGDLEILPVSGSGSTGPTPARLVGSVGMTSCVTAPTSRQCAHCKAYLDPS